MKHIYSYNNFVDESLLPFNKEDIKKTIKNITDKTKLKEDGIRSTSPEFQQAINNQFDILEKDFGIITIKTSNHEQIVKHILENYTP